MQNDNETLIAHLREQGCSDEEIRGVLQKLQQHDQQAFRDSIFDSIERGTLDLKALIEEAKKKGE